MTIRAFLHLAPPQTFSNFSDVNAYCRRLWDALYQLRKGKSENVGEVTLTAGAATTVVRDIRASIQTGITFDPRTASAATELYGGTMYVLDANRASEQFTITHVNSGTADRTFFYILTG
jgi:hypothetical protein